MFVIRVVYSAAVYNALHERELLNVIIKAIPVHAMTCVIHTAVDFIVSSCCFVLFARKWNLSINTATSMREYKKQ